MIDLTDYYGIAPLGGVFLLGLGLVVMGAAPFPNWRNRSIWIGLVLGAVAAMFSTKYFLVRTSPTPIQIGSLFFAVAVEVAAFAVLMPRLYRRGERNVVGGTLAIVGAHFVLMLPAFGYLIVALGILCMVNGTLLWREPRYSISLGWFVDGAIKTAVGAALILRGLVL